MTEEALARLQEALGDRVEALEMASPRRLRADVPAGGAKEALRILREEVGYRHLSAISGVDGGEALEVIYQVSGPQGVLLSLRTRVPRDAPRLPTATDVYPSSILYEREVHDLLGVEFEGHPDLRRLLLYEGWPEGEYPLRKDWKPAKEGEEGA